jgi:uncharacterized membrane protein YraQ (UPF0718 family)
MTEWILRHTGWAGWPGLSRIDRVLAALALALAVLFVIDADQGARSLAFTLQSLIETAPYLIGSIAIAAAATASGADGVIARAFQGRESLMILFAALLGGLSPFCSCGVIPLIAALLAMGVPLGPVMAFWLASPVIDPAQFVLTVGIIGMDFAVAKTLAAVAIGLAGGFATTAMVRGGLLNNALRPGIGDGGCGGSKVRNAKPVVWAFWRETARREQFARKAFSTTFFLAKWLAFAFFLESLMLAYIPADAIAGLLGGDGVLPILTATLVGVPAYLNGYAALPLVGGLMQQGMSPGAALSFVVAGGITSIPAAIAVFALARMRLFATYIGLALTGSLIAGLLFQLAAG